MDGDGPDIMTTLREVANGSIAARELTSDRLAALRTVHAATGAVQFFDDEQAMADAEELDRAFAIRGPVGPFHGLPITVKDWIDVAGWPCAGTTGDASRRPTRDATAVARLRAAGAVVLAKTVAWTNIDGDRVRHPVDPARTPGGSSTGEAVAVAARTSWLGVASDSGGSVRLPAAWCGVLGLKPTTGLVPTTGHFPRVGDRSDGRTQIGLLTTDLALLGIALATMAGPDGLDAGVPPVPFPLPSPLITRHRRFGVVAGDDSWPCAPDVALAVERAATRLEEAGLERVSWAGPPLAEAHDVTQRYWDRWTQTGSEVAGQLWDWDRYRRHWLVAFRDLDVLVAPTTRDSAPVDRPVTGDDFVYTLPASLSGAPALSVPAGTDDDDLPVAVQLIGRRWHDADLLDVARCITG